MNAVKHQYAAVLEGYLIDLRLLEHCFTEDSCKIELVEVGDKHYGILTSEDVLLPDNYKLHTDSFGKEFQLDANFDIVQERCEGILKRIQGAAKLLEPSYRSVSLSGLQRYGADGNLVGASSGGSFPADLRNYPMPSTATGLPDLVRLWAAEGKKDQAVEFALDLYGSLPITWASLYVVYETIRQDVGGEKALLKKGWISSSNKRYFTRTANEVRDIRQGIRHGGLPKSTGNPQPLMKLHEGETLVRHLLNQWLGEKTGKVMAPRK